MSAGRALALLSPPGDRHARLIPTMVALTLLTGVVDAVSYLSLGHVFVANMTGNIVFLGFALAGAGGLSIASSLIALGAFVLAGRLGGAIAAALSRRHARLLCVTATLQAVLIASALALSLLSAQPPSHSARYALTALLAFAMGLQNAAAQELAVPELTTTVLTKTLTGLASDPRAARHLSARRLIAVLAMLLGALAGGLLALRVSVAAGLGLALALAALAVSLIFGHARIEPVEPGRP